MLCKVQYDRGRRQTVSDELVQLGACVRLVLRRVWATPVFPQQLTSTAWPAVCSCALHHGVSHPPNALSYTRRIATSMLREAKKNVPQPKNGKQRGQGLKTAWNQLPSCPAGGKEWVTYGFWCLIITESGRQFCCCLIKCRYLKALWVTVANIISAFQGILFQLAVFSYNVSLQW